MPIIISVSETTAQWAEQRQLSCIFSTETGSTNDDAKKNAFRESEDFCLYVTTHQTQGRGRGTNVWLDTGSGEGLLSTWSYALKSSPQSITAPRIGLALFNAAAQVWPSLAWSIKAPNDLFLNGLKVGGLLVETVSSGSQFRLLIGLGLNILNHPRRFAEAEHLGKTLHGAPEEGDWFQFLDELKNEFSRALTDSQRATLSDESCRQLMQALNANSAKPFSVQQVTPQGDLVHSGGKLHWKDL